MHTCLEDSLSSCSTPKALCLGSTWKLKSATSANCCLLCYGFSLISHYNNHQFRHHNQMCMAALALQVILHWLLAEPETCCS